MNKKSISKTVNPLIVEEKLITGNVSSTAANNKTFELPKASKKNGPLKISVLKNRH